MKRAVPSLPKSAVGTDRSAFDQALKENVELLTGQRGGQIATLPTSATLDDVIRKLNEIISRLQ